MADEPDWTAALDAINTYFKYSAEFLFVRPPSATWRDHGFSPRMDTEESLPSTPQWGDANVVAVLMDTEMLDRMRVTREINRRMTEAFLRDWRPADVQGSPARAVVAPHWAEQWAEAERRLKSALIECEVRDRNAQAKTWWRSQRRPRRRMDLAEAAAKVRAEYGLALKVLGEL